MKGSVAPHRQWVALQASTKGRPVKGSDGVGLSPSRPVGQASTKGRPVKGSDQWQTGDKVVVVEPQRRAAR